MRLIYIILLILLACSNPSQKMIDQVIKYRLDFNFSDDLFEVNIEVDSLTEYNQTFCFVASVPGTYEYLNFGRLVKEFKAFDRNGNEIAVKKDGLNNWIFSEPERVKRIHYKIDDSYESVNIQPMGGSNLKDDLALVNTFAVFGYFSGLQSIPLTVRLMVKDDWKTGTALTKIGPNYYHASNFDELADSPILSGKLTEASLKIKQTEISVFAYSPNDRVTALQLLEQTKASIKSVIDYIGFNATDHYTFLFNFLENTDLETVKFRNFGALEHSYSSLYVFPEAQVLAEIDRVSAIMRHEFFHILTPLNLHSQLIESFDFSDPKPSRHIWLYEGVTEWAALSSNVTDSSSFIVYINQLNQKINAYQAAKSSASLVDLALRTYDNEGSEFQTFYQKGAVVAALLDILIIKLSDGNKNLRSVLIELSKKYGPNRGFSEDDFFAEFVSHSYPELSDFIDQYIDGNEDLPIDQLFSTIGVSYALGDVDPNPKTIGLKLRRKDEEPFHISGFSVDYQGDLRPGDVLSRFDNVPVTGPSDLFPAIDEAYKKYAIGDSYPLTVIRGGKPVELTIKMFKRLKSNLLIIDKTPSREQLRYRQLLYFNSKN